MQHDCKLPEKAKQDGFGGSISYCLEDASGELWVGNDANENQVNFCPFCGFEAKVRIKS